MAKSDEQKYRFRVSDHVLVFESRYYAQKYVAVHFLDLLRFGDPIIEKREYGYVIILVKALTFRDDLV